MDLHTNYNDTTDLKVGFSILKISNHTSVI